MTASKVAEVNWNEARRRRQTVTNQLQVPLTQVNTRLAGFG
jgi:hypothetical protein